MSKLNPLALQRYAVYICQLFGMGGKSQHGDCLLNFYWLSHAEWVFP